MIPLHAPVPSWGFAADLNPIGSIAKGDIKRFLLYAASKYDFPSLAAVAHATPTAELVPASHDAVTGTIVAQTVGLKESTLPTNS